METKRIKCPKCGGLLDVTNPNGEDVLLVTCPNPGCGAKIRFRWSLGETQLAPVTDTTAIGYLKKGQHTYPLREGKNTIGRYSSSSDVDLQIETDDRTMSRKHAEINVVRLKNGRVKAIIHDVRDEQKMTAKPLLVEDEPLLKPDKIVLTNGDLLTLGDTIVKYVQE
ncbi:MAG: FHA domain-containing protein [Prevotella sp.]|nr:FHA domain-containing protein [Prevotella sp.]